MNSNLRKGLQYEDLARDYLIEQGLELLESNYRCRYGEIDLVMHDHDEICFVEVKFRKSLAFGGAAVALPPGKQRKIVKSAQHYIANNRRLGNRALRFDAFLIQQQPDGGNEFNWIRNAFCTE